MVAQEVSNGQPLEPRGEDAQVDVRTDGSGVNSNGVSSNGVNGSGVNINGTEENGADANGNNSSIPSFVSGRFPVIRMRAEQAREVDDSKFTQRRIEETNGSKPNEDEVSYRKIALPNSTFRDENYRRLARAYKKIKRNPSAHRLDDIWNYSVDLERVGLLDECENLRKLIREDVPTVPKIREEQLIHGDKRIDEYAWMSDPKMKEAVRDVCREENAFALAHLDELRPLQRYLFEEALNRLPLEHYERVGRIYDYVYYEFMTRGVQHPVLMRAHASEVAQEEGGDLIVSLDAEEEPEEPNMEVVLDCNLEVAELRRGLADRKQVPERKLNDIARKINFSASFDISQGDLFVYQYAYRGDEHFETAYIDLKTGQGGEIVIEDTVDGAVVSPDGSAIFYAKYDEQSRMASVHLHMPFSDFEDVTLFEEQDPCFDVSVSKSSDGRFVFIESENFRTSEIWFMRTDKPGLELKLLKERKEGIVYSVVPHGDYLYMMTNEDAHHKKIVRAPIDTPDLSHWETVVAENEEKWIKDFDIIEGHLVVTYGVNYREEAEEEDLSDDAEKGEDNSTPEDEDTPEEKRDEDLIDPEVRGFIDEIVALNLETKEQFDIPYPEDVEDEVGFSYAFDSVSDSLREQKSTLRYSTRLTPERQYSFDFKTKKLSFVSQEQYLEYDPSPYSQERVWVESHDGVEVPMTLARPYDVEGPIPYFVMAYGQYGDEVSMAFDDWPRNYEHFLISLLERECGVAFLHVRGGGELGPDWYEGGIGENLLNGVYDGVACVQHLIDNDYTTADVLGIGGRSAGGAWASNVVNMLGGEYFQVGLIDVPVGDVVTSLLTPSEPGSMVHRKIWGDPYKNRATFRRIRKWSPYDGVKRQSLPNLLISQGMEDRRVQGYAPLKLAAKMRDRMTNDDECQVLNVSNMGAGHFGFPGRLDHLAETMLQAAFFLHHTKACTTSDITASGNPEDEDIVRFTNRVMNPYETLGSDPT